MKPQLRLLPFFVPYLMPFLATARAQAPLYGVFGQTGENLGASIAPIGDVDGDGHGDLVIGSRTADGMQPGAGLVRVYSGTTTLPLLTLLGEHSGDEFGYAVAGLPDITGDGVPEVLVGAPRYEPVLGTNRGALYVFSGATGAQLSKHVGSLDNDRLGWDVVHAGDLNNDGVADFATSAPFADSSGSTVDIGFVYVYSGATHSILRTYVGASAGDLFGYDLDSGFDHNGDGVPDLLAGAPSHQVGSNASAGAAYVLSGAASFTNLAQIAGGSNGEAGFSVAFVPDATFDGKAEIALGEPGWAGPGANAGRVRVYSGSSGALLREFEGSAGERLGWSVAGLADFDADGRGDVIVGCPGFDNPPATDSGLARLFSVQTGAQLSVMGGYASFDSFGWRVSSMGDLNNDGFPEAMASTPFTSVSFSGGGAVGAVLGHSFAPQNYCTAKVNSAGCTPNISYGGAASLTLGNGILVVGQNVHPGMVGILIWSRTSNAVPFYGGTLCLGGPVFRTGGQSATTITTTFPCKGQYTFMFSAPYMSANLLTAGQDVYAQYWSRDTGFSAPNSVGLTNGLHFRVLP